MKTAFFCFSQQGEEVARRLALTPDERVVRVPKGGLAATTAAWWGKVDALVFVSSLGVAVRAVGPHLKDKESDPAVILVTEDGRQVLPVAGAHLGGGRDRAETFAKRLGASLVLTTGTDREGLIAPDLLAARLGWKLFGKEALPEVNRRLLDEHNLSWWGHPSCRLPALPKGYRPSPTPEGAAVIFSPQKVERGPGQVQIVPPMIAAGMGCRKGAALESLRKVLGEAMAREGLHPESLAEIRTIPEKAGEGALADLAEELDVPLVVVDRETLLALEGDFTPSAAERHFGLPGAAEPAAASAGTLLSRRIARDGVTVALASLNRVPGGKLTILGTGPGDGKYITLQGRRALEEADAVVAYRLYADLLPPSWLEGKDVETYSMGEEELRADRAVALAEEGHKVVLLSGGDPILFGMAALALRKAHGRVEAEVASGVTAAQMGGVMMGAPYVNGLVLLSLSDYLQPWEAVRKAMEGAARTGLTVALYNPVKRDLGEKLAAVRKVFGGEGYRRASLIRDGGRPSPSRRDIPLEDLAEEMVDMRTLIVLPGASVEPLGGLLLDARGYGGEIGHD